MLRQLEQAVSAHVTAETAEIVPQLASQIMPRLADMQSQLSGATRQAGRETADRIVLHIVEGREVLDSVNNTTGLLSSMLGRVEVLTLNAQRTRARECFGTMEVITSHRIASDSPDHLHPWGTAQDNSRNERFNARLITLIPRDRLSVLDLGCSGGGMVRSFIEQGFLAVGVEGSDYSQNMLRAEWATIPEFLFTADITKPFRVHAESQVERQRFGVITLWEVIEHIAEYDLPAVFANIDDHLLAGGIVIMSVSPQSDRIDGVELHQTIRPSDWWADYLRRAGWQNHPKIVDYFSNDFVRGGANAPGSFHFVVSRTSERPAVTSRMVHLL